MADEVLNDLFDIYSVVVDDRTMEWKVVDDEEEDDEFVKGAQLSQRSAFARKARGSSDKRVDDTTPKDTMLRQDVIASHDDDVILPYEEGTKEVTCDLESLTVVELKDKLRHLGVPVSGKKADLISRLSNL